MMPKKTLLLLALCAALGALAACQDDTEYQGGDGNNGGEADASNNGGQDDASDAQPDAEPDAEPDIKDEPDVEPPPDIPVIEPDMEEEDAFEPACSFEDEFAPNQGPDRAANLGLGAQQGGLYICADTSDWFSFQAIAGQTVLLYADFDPQVADLDMYLYREGQYDREAPLAKSDTPNQQEFIQVEIPENGTYFVELASFQGGESAYTLFVGVGCNTDDDCGSRERCYLPGQYCVVNSISACNQDDDYEPNESASTATPLEATPEEPLALDGLYICPENQDHYRVSVPANAGLQIALSHDSNRNADLLLFNDRGAFFGAGDERTGGEDLQARFLPEGDYILLVDASQQGSGLMRYDLSVARESGRCASDRDCAGVPGREFCDLDAGTCVGITADATQGFGDACDDDADCGEGTEGCYEGTEGAGDNLCTVTCNDDSACAELGEGAYCLVLDRLRRTGVCVPGCEEDFDCSSDRFCNTETSRCDSRACGNDADCTREGESCVYQDQGGGFGLPTGLCVPYEPESQACGVGAAPDDADNGTSSRGGLVPLTEGAAFVEGLSICDEDEDWYVLELTGPSSNLTVDAGFVGRGADLDLYITGEDGRTFGAGVEPDANPEQASAQYLAAGRYYVRVNKFPIEGSPAEVEYNLSVNVGETDCRLEERACDGSFPLRASCNADTGSCDDFQGGGAVELGEACDTRDDCGEGAELCWIFEGGGEGLNICTHYCQSGRECNDVPGTVCVPIRRDIGVCIEEQ
jgi:hypothetical protein